MSKSQNLIIPCYDRNRRTCIQVDRTNKHVKFMVIDISFGLEVHTTPIDLFDGRYSPIEEYPIEKACQLFKTYSQTLGATREAMEYLGQIIDISEKEMEMATTKKKALEPEIKPKAEKPKAEKKVSASQMFQDLIMLGTMTDDQIFEEVQSTFGLDEKKRGYVKWYRNHLKKQGANPPEAKV